MLNTRIKPFKNISYYKKKFYEIKEIDLKSNWNVFFFYPYSYSFICPLELKNISNKIKEFKNLNTKIYAISNDSHFVQKNWIENELKFINFPFISDFNHKISNNFNILNKKDGNCLRSTIIIDKNLIIKYINIVDDSIGRSIDEILKNIKMLQFINTNENKLCPYSWNNDSKSIEIN
uniref:Alkyl hydroperoxide reductase C n=1 Tax=Carsonella ruddii TaxID=114186 RepID=Q9AJ00_CARRU|nr:alkyl hydroperoxide reductase small subunit [Candidatus Carsonella ruddii]